MSTAEKKSCAVSQQMESIKRFMSNKEQKRERVERERKRIRERE